MFRLLSQLQFYLHCMKVKTTQFFCHLQDPCQIHSSIDWTNLPVNPSAKIHTIQKRQQKKNNSFPPISVRQYGQDIWPSHPMWMFPKELSRMSLYTVGHQPKSVPAWHGLPRLAWKSQTDLHRTLTQTLLNIELENRLCPEPPHPTSLPWPH